MYQAAMTQIAGFQMLYKPRVYRLIKILPLYRKKQF